MTAKNRNKMIPDYELFESLHRESARYCKRFVELGEELPSAFARVRSVFDSMQKHMAELERIPPILFERYLDITGGIREKLHRLEDERQELTAYYAQVLEDGE